MAENLDIRRLILIGKTGNGKSSTGNSILGRMEFMSQRSLCAITKECQVSEGIQRQNWPRYEVCDTPGLFDTDVKLEDRILEIQRSVEICPRPHAFLIVFSALNRMSQDEKFTIDKLRLMFGEDVFKHSIIVFTRGNEFTSDAEFEAFYKENPLMLELHKRCGCRIARVENKTGNEGAPIGEDFNHLLELIEKVSDRGKRVYTYDLIRKHIEALKKHGETYTGTGDIESKLADISEKLNHQLGGKWDKRLFGLSIIVVLGVGAAVAGVGGHVGNVNVKVNSGVQVVVATATALAATAKQGLL